MDWPFDSDFKGDGLRSVPPNLPHRPSSIGHVVKFLFSRNGAKAQRKFKKKDEIDEMKSTRNLSTVWTAVGRNKKFVASLRRGVNHFGLDSRNGATAQRKL